MAGTSDDDPTPTSLPPVIENLRLMAILCDLTALAEAHYRRLGELAVELRHMRDPVGPAYLDRLGRALDDYHAPAARLAREILDGVVAKEG